MRSIFLAIGSAALFSSVLALPTKVEDRASTVDITVKTGDGDASVGATIPVGRVVATTESGLSQVREGVAASVASDNTISCQAFSDNKGTVKLGEVFTSTTASVFGQSDGSTESILADAVPIGAFCCVATKDGFGACDPAASKGTTSTKTPPPSSNGNNTPKVRVQLNGLDEAAAQGEVPADNSVFLLAAHPPFFTAVTSGFIEDAEGLTNPSCQAFSDMLGEHAIGQPINAAGTDFNNGQVVTVVSLRCNYK